ncbi:endoglucanase 8-like [Canna indica]|uniref:cellulase n=1 Tax=Canna indica TaxID=4628 RepID=A0AAQ3KLE7_9LILI|nr:endoglucanase 8-like [Canna indica]
MAAFKSTVVFYSALLLYTATIVAVMMPSGSEAFNGGDYAQALSKSIMFFEGQRSGKLPSSQRIRWRKDSALNDGKDVGVDLTGGYYDAGDNVKFGFPMAFTATMLAWSIIEFGEFYSVQEMYQARVALLWNTDYLMKATAQIPNRMFVQVGDPNTDHSCWERPEDMDTPRNTYEINPSRPGSEIAAETAAALAAASIVFRSSRAGQANQLLDRAKAVYDFATKYRGSYDSVGKPVCPFYCSHGYEDELVWGAAWLNKATNSRQYDQYIASELETIRVQDDNIYDTEFGWDDKHAGYYILLLQNNQGPNQDVSKYRMAADNFACSLIPESPTKSVKYTPGGLLFKSNGANMQSVTSLSFLLMVYARYLWKVNGNVQCGNKQFPASRLYDLARSQVDYIMGKNPMGMSYMVGYGYKWPRSIHHRGASLPSMDSHPQRINCAEGWNYFNGDPGKWNPNWLIGAVVGGPNDGSDHFDDSFHDSSQTEPTTYINAPLTGLLAYFSKNS